MIITIEVGTTKFLGLQSGDNVLYFPECKRRIGYRGRMFWENCLLHTFETQIHKCLLNKTAMKYEVFTAFIETQKYILH